MPDYKRKQTDLLQQRTTALAEAQAAYDGGNMAEYSAKMETVKNLNAEIDATSDILKELDRKWLAAPLDPAEERDKADERGSALMKGDRLSLTAQEVRKALFVAKSTTLATGTIAQPTGVGSIHDPMGNMVSSILDQVYVQDLTGMGGMLEPYVITELDAKGGKVTTNAGKARTASTSPTFGYAKITPYEVNVTDYVDRNISRLTPARYYEKIHGMALRALRRKAVGLIVNGDGQSTPDMYGMKNAKNQAGAAIYATADITAINENLLDELYFSYGSDAAIGQNARLMLHKADLKAIGKVRNSDKQRVFRVSPDPGNPNVGVIEDGGVVIPYTIVPDLTPLSTSTQSSSAAIQTMIYGDPANYELGLFGDYSIRVDESIKGEERMLTILGDVMLGGNVIVDKGFVVATLPKS